MMARRPQSPLAVLCLGALFGVFIYVMIFGQMTNLHNESVNAPNQDLEVGRYLPEPSAQLGALSLLLSHIDHIVLQSSSKLKTGEGSKLVSQEIAKEIANFLSSKLLNDNASFSKVPACGKQSNSSNTDLPVIYIVTPTYRRPEQVPELTRFAQTLLNVPAIHWIVVEDSTAASPHIASLLQRYGIPFTHLNAQMPDKYQKAKVKPRGVANRNAALKWIREHAESGVIYFADDDNTYDIRLFEEMRYTQKVSMWPVGLVTKIGVSSPVVKNGKVVGFYDGWAVNRKFPIDMAGFAVNLRLLKKRTDVEFPFVPGYEEDGFLKKMGITNNDIEPKARNCTKILVWHTQTKKNSPANKTMATNKKYEGTNIDELYKVIV